MLENHVFAFCFYQCFQTQKESHGYFQEKKKKMKQELAQYQ